MSERVQKRHENTPEIPRRSPEKGTKKSPQKVQTYQRNGQKRKKNVVKGYWMVVLLNGKVKFRSSESERRYEPT
jgi:hypothetical protein